jgi:hypothetical protein
VTCAHARFNDGSTPIIPAGIGNDLFYSPVAARRRRRADLSFGEVESRWGRVVQAVQRMIA